MSRAPPWSIEQLEGEGVTKLHIAGFLLTNALQLVKAYSLSGDAKSVAKNRTKAKLIELYKEYTASLSLEELEPEGEEARLARRAAEEANRWKDYTHCVALVGSPLFYSADQRESFKVVNTPSEAEVDPAVWTYRDLPFEMIALILSFADQGDAFAALWVCHAWRSAALMVLRGTFHVPPWLLDSIGNFSNWVQDVRLLHAKATVDGEERMLQGVLVPRLSQMTWPLGISDALVVTMDASIPARDSVLHLLSLAKCPAVVVLDRMDVLIQSALRADQVYTAIEAMVAEVCTAHPLDVHASLLFGCRCDGWAMTLQDVARAFKVEPQQLWGDGKVGHRRGFHVFVSLLRDAYSSGAVTKLSSKYPLKECVVRALLTLPRTPIVHPRQRRPSLTFSPGGWALPASATSLVLCGGSVWWKGRDTIVRRVLSGVARLIGDCPSGTRTDVFPAGSLFLTSNIKAMRHGYTGGTLQLMTGARGSAVTHAMSPCLSCVPLACHAMLTVPPERASEWEYVNTHNMALYQVFDDGNDLRRTQDLEEGEVRAPNPFVLSRRLLDLVPRLGGTVMVPPRPFIQEGVSCNTATGVTRSPNKHNRFYWNAEPLPDELTEALVRDCSSSGEPVSAMDDITRAQWLMDEFAWDRDVARKVWAIDSNGCMLVNMSPNNVSEIKDSVVAAFRWFRGPCCGVRVHGVRFNLMDATLLSDAIHRGGGQVIPAVKRALLGCVYDQPIVKSPQLDLEFCAQAEHLAVFFKRTCEFGGMVNYVRESPFCTAVMIGATVDVSNAQEFVRALPRVLDWDVVRTTWKSLGDPRVEGSPARRLCVERRVMGGMTAELPAENEFWTVLK